MSWNATSRTKHFNADYTPGGGDKKVGSLWLDNIDFIGSTFQIEQRKLSWNVTPKVGSLDKASHRPGGGQVKIENRKLDWKVDSKVGSTKNLKHKPGGGNVQITDQKVELKAESKIGSLKNVKHRPGGGDKKIFNDKEYIRQINQIGTMSAGPGSMSGSSSDLEKKVSLVKRPSLPNSSFQSQIVRKLVRIDQIFAHKLIFLKLQSPMSTGF